MAWLIKDENLYTLLNYFDELKYLSNASQLNQNEEEQLKKLKPLLAFCLDMQVNNQEVINRLGAYEIEVNQHSYKRKAEMIESQLPQPGFFKKVNAYHASTESTPPKTVPCLANLAISYNMRYTSK